MGIHSGPGGSQKSVSRKWFFEESHPLVPDTTEENLVVRVPGHVHHRHLRIQLSNSLGQLPAIHLRHDHVGEEQVKATGPLLTALQRSRPAVGFHNLVSLPLEHASSETANLMGIFHE